MMGGLNDRDLAAIRGVFGQYDQISKVVLFGSRAKGNHRPGSDIDLAIEGNGLDFSLLVQIGNELDDILLPYTFDLVIKSQITDQEVLNHIDRVGVGFYSSNISTSH